jgi:hypothetical protein
MYNTKELLSIYSIEIVLAPSAYAPHEEFKISIYFSSSLDEELCLSLELTCEDKLLDDDVVVLDEDVVVLDEDVVVLSFELVDEDSLENLLELEETFPLPKLKFSQPQSSNNPTRTKDIFLFIKKLSFLIRRVYHILLN